MKAEAPAGAASRVVGVVAGNGVFPVLFARGARRAGAKVVAAALEGEADPALAAEVDELFWEPVTKLGHIVDGLRSRGVKEAAFAGGVRKLVAFRNLRPDWRTMRVLAGLRHFNDDTLLKAIAAFFESEGVRIIASTEFLQEVLAPEGKLGTREPTEAERRDIALGIDVARAIGRADVGQTVVTRGGSVIAVEAAEGTDGCIKRAGELAGEGIVVVKRCKPGQDERFDLPAIGPKTIAAIAAARGAVLAVEARKTVVLDAAEVARQADAAGIAVVGI